MSVAAIAAIAIALLSAALMGMAINAAPPVWSLRSTR